MKTSFRLFTSRVPLSGRKCERGPVDKEYFPRTRQQILTIIIEPGILPIAKLSHLSSTETEDHLFLRRLLGSSEGGLVLRI